MIDLKIKTGQLLQYDETEDKVLVDGKSNSNWSAAFVPNGAEEPTFFGFINASEKKCYDIYGGVSKLNTEDSIKL